MISSVQYISAANDAVRATIDGVVKDVRLYSDGHVVAAIKDWIAAGNTPEPYVPPPAPVPQSVSAMQAKVALSRAGLLTGVQAWIAAQDAETQLIWNSTVVFNRTSPLLASAATALNLSSDQIDALFVTAAAIAP